MKRNGITVDRLHELLNYCPDTGIFTRRVKTASNTKLGERVGSRNAEGYLLIMLDLVRYPAHRLAWLYMYGTWPLGVIDHVDGRKDNNRIANLRDVHHSVNLQNQRRARADNKLGILGVSARRNKFSASIFVGGRQRCIGSFFTAADAQKAYIEAKRRLHEGCTL